MRCPISIDDIKTIEQDIIHYRRSIHLHPETGFEEIKTSEMVAGLLEEFDLDVIKGIGKTTNLQLSNTTFRSPSDLSAVPHHKQIHSGDLFADLQIYQSSIISALNYTWINHGHR